MIILRIVRTLGPVVLGRKEEAQTDLRNTSHIKCDIDLITSHGWHAATVPRTSENHQLSPIRNGSNTSNDNNPGNGSAETLEFTQPSSVKSYHAGIYRSAVYLPIQQPVNSASSNDTYVPNVIVRKVKYEESTHSGKRVIKLS